MSADRSGERRKKIVNATLQKSFECATKNLQNRIFRLHSFADGGLHSSFFASAVSGTEQKWFKSGNDQSKRASRGARSIMKKRL